MTEQKNTSRSKARRWWLMSGILLAVLITVIVASGGFQTVADAFRADGVIGQWLAEALPDSLSGRLFPQVSADQALVASGIIQADQVALASEFGGQVARVYVAKGERVTAGDRILQLDTTLIDAKIEAARAAVVVAEAGLARVKAGPSAGQIAVAETQLAQAQVAQVAAALVISDTLALVDNPQEILMQIAVTRGQIEAASHEVSQASALKDAAELVKDKFEEVYDEWGNVDSYLAHVAGGNLINLPDDFPCQLPGCLDGTYEIRDFEIVIQDGHYDIYKQIDVNIPLQFHLTPNDWWQAWIGLNAATAYQEGLQASLSQLYRQYTYPNNLEAQASAAVAALAQAEAQVVAAQAQVDGLKAGASAADIEVVKAQVQQARAAVNSLVAERELLVIVAYMDGLVVDLLVHPGEVVAPGAGLVTIADLANLRLTVYVPENQIGPVRPDQAVQLFVDGYPDRPFSGQVARIADQAQFTPRNITTVDERVNLVFAVEICLDNTGGLLKPGMAAEAFFLTSNPE